MLDLVAQESWPGFVRQAGLCTAVLGANIRFCEMRTSASRISICRLAYSLTVHSTLLAIASNIPIILIGNQIADSVATTSHAGGSTRRSQNVRFRLTL